MALQGAIWQSAAMRLVLLMIGLTGVGCAAQAQMTAAEFDRYTRGQTFYYGSGGAPYGGEEYLDNRRVRWSFLDGQCESGYWYEANGLICFLYDDRPDPQCWSFEQSDNGLVARFVGSESSTELYEVEKSSEPLMCLGPDIGV